jgi:hypothetical protein
MSKAISMKRTDNMAKKAILVGCFVFDTCIQIDIMSFKSQKRKDPKQLPVFTLVNLLSSLNCTFLPVEWDIIKCLQL